MLTDSEETGSRGGGLGSIGEDGTYGPETTTQLLVRQLRRRWKILGAIVVTAITTYAVYQVDGTVSKDVTVFGFITLALLAYVLLTIRSDLKLE